MINAMIRKYTVYIYVGQTFGNGVSIFWLGNGVEIRIFVYPIKFLAVLRYDCLVLCFNKDITFKSVMSS